MVNKKSLLCLSIILGIAFLCSGCLKKEKETLSKTSPEVQKMNTANKQPISKPVKKIYDLYSQTPYDLPLASILDISNLPLKTKEVIDKILEDSQGFYFLQAKDGNVFIILQNPIKQTDTYLRHALQFVEIKQDGTILYHNAGYSGIEGETSNPIVEKEDYWLFDNSSEPSRPLKHIAYGESGKVKFIELWNYDEKEPVKYQMKDSKKKVISMLKETQENESNYKKEHIFYDNEGQTKMSLTINYEGANINRVIYYNSHDLVDSVSILCEYLDGNKIKEQIYNENYELVKTVTSEYDNDKRINIRAFDNQGNEIAKISS